MAATRANSRRRPLHTCAASMLGVFDTAYRRAQHLNGPLGKLTKRTMNLATSALPFASRMQHMGLAILSFTDDHILFLERVAESIFPPSGRVFDKIDMLVYCAEGMPSRFDEALNTLPSVMQQKPFLDWVVMYIVWWLKFLISILIHWGLRNAKEKEIVIDLNSNTGNTPSIESAEKTDLTGGQGQSEFSSIEFIESSEKDNFTSTNGQSFLTSDEYIASVEDANPGSEAPSLLTSGECTKSATPASEGSASIGCTMEEKKAELGILETDNVRLPIAAECTNKEQGQVLPLVQDEMSTNTNAFSPSESFRSAESEYVTSPSADSEPFHEAKSTEHVELPSPDENANKEDRLPVSGVVKEGSKVSVDSSENVFAVVSPRRQFKDVLLSPASGASTGKNKSMGDKTVTHSLKNNTNKRDDQVPILDLFEAKWHLK